MEDYIKAFDIIVKDSIKRGISIFLHPAIYDFLRQYKLELSQLEVIQELQKYIDYMRDTEIEYPCGITDALPADLKILRKGSRSFLCEGNIYIEL